MPTRQASAASSPYARPQPGPQRTRRGRWLPSMVPAMGRTMCVCWSWYHQSWIIGPDVSGPSLWDPARGSFVNIGAGLGWAPGSSAQRPYMRKTACIAWGDTYGIHLAGSNGNGGTTFRANAADRWTGLDTTVYGRVDHPVDNAAYPRPCGSRTAVIDPSDQTRSFVASTGGGVYRFTGSGATRNAWATAVARNYTALAFSANSAWDVVYATSDELNGAGQSGVWAIINRGGTSTVIRLDNGGVGAPSGGGLTDCRDIATDARYRVGRLANADVVPVIVGSGTHRGMWTATIAVSPSSGSFNAATHVTWAKVFTPDDATDRPQAAVLRQPNGPNAAPIMAALVHWDANATATGTYALSAPAGGGTSPYYRWAYRTLNLTASGGGTIPEDPIPCEVQTVEEAIGKVLGYCCADGGTGQTYYGAGNTLSSSISGGALDEAIRALGMVQAAATNFDRGVNNTPGSGEWGTSGGSLRIDATAFARTIRELLGDTVLFTLDDLYYQWMGPQFPTYAFAAAWLSAQIEVDGGRFADQPYVTNTWAKCWDENDTRRQNAWVRIMNAAFPGSEARFYPTNAGAPYYEANVAGNKLGGRGLYMRSAVLGATALPLRSLNRYPIATRAPYPLGAGTSTPSSTVWDVISNAANINTQMYGVSRVYPHPAEIAGEPVTEKSRFGGINYQGQGMAINPAGHVVIVGKGYPVISENVWTATPADVDWQPFAHGLGALWAQRDVVVSGPEARVWVTDSDRGMWYFPNARQYAASPPSVIAARDDMIPGTDNETQCVTVSRTDPTTLLVGYTAPGGSPGNAYPGCIWRMSNPWTGSPTFTRVKEWHTTFTNPGSCTLACDYLDGAGQLRYLSVLQNYGIVRSNAGGGGGATPTGDAAFTSTANRCIVQFSSTAGVIWISVPTRGLYRSTDYGATWTFIWSMAVGNASECDWSNHIAVDNDGTTLWIARPAGGIYRWPNADSAAPNGTNTNPPTGAATVTGGGVTSSSRFGAICVDPVRGDLWGVQEIDAVGEVARLWRLPFAAPGGTWVEEVDDEIREGAQQSQSIRVYDGLGFISTMGSGVLRRV